ncbi:hypothetical protein Tco_0358925 [Tanacetum coccineum]
MPSAMSWDSSEDEDDDMDIEADEEDEDDEMDVEIDEEAEEEHLAPAYPVVVALPATAPSAEETEPFETDESAATPPPHPAYRHVQLGFPFQSLYCTCMSGLRLPDYLLYLPHQHHHYLHGLQSHHRFLPIITTFNWRLGVTQRDMLDMGSRMHRDEDCETLEGAPFRTICVGCTHERDLVVVRRDTDEIYTRLDDEQGQRQLLAGRVNMLFRDRRTHAHTRSALESGGWDVERGWGYERWMRAILLMDGVILSLRTQCSAQMAEIDRVSAADRTRQQQIIQTLTAVQTLQREMVPLQGLVTTLQGQVTDLQGQVMTLQGQVTTLQGQQGSAEGPAQPELPEDTGSSS